MQKYGRGAKKPTASLRSHALPIVRGEERQLLWTVRHDPFELGIVINCHMVDFELTGWVFIQNVPYHLVFAPTQFIQILQYDKSHRG